MTQKNAVIWITGASSGLGRSLAINLAERGNRVIASARNEQQLAMLAAENTNITALVCDITDRDSLDRAALQMATITPHLDQVIFNAGNCEYLDFPDPDWDALYRVMQVNYFGSINCLRVALPFLRNKKSRDENAKAPHIVGIASQVTAAPFPRAEAYGASKAALQYFYHSLRIDLAPENIDVTVVDPGFIDTPLTRKNDFAMPFLMDVDAASRRIINKLESRPRRYRFPWRLTALLSISRFLPGLWQKMMAGTVKNNSEAGRSEIGKEK
ncbi:MAG: NAD(P)-dependent dehydrogenase (short-subunit alcohol dehydrogenase family) [Planctomycetota bacterium]|jgi:NAD(P)-dependent dehydrogenase (short-subunit alcohol dehydrogenase family)